MSAERSRRTGARAGTWLRPRGAAWSLGSALMALGLALRAPAQTPAPAAGGWQTSAAVMQGVDSNVLLSATHPVAGATTNLNFSLARNWLGPRSSFTLLYTPAAEIFAGHTELNYLAQAGAANWSYAWRNTTLDWTLDGERMPERAGNFQAGLSGLAAVANASQASSLALILAGANTGLTLHHQYSLRSSWSVSLTGGVQSFTQDDPLLAELARLGPNGLAPQPGSSSRSAGVGASWTHRLTARRSIGVNATHTEMFYSNPAQHLLYTSVQATLTQQLGSGLILDLGAGPAWNTQPRAGGVQAGSLPRLGYSADAGLTWMRGQQQYGVTWSHSEQPSYVPGGVTTDTLALHYGLQWARDWSARLNAGYSRYRGVARAAAGGRDESNTLLGGQIAYRLAKDWTLSANASYNSQVLPFAAATGLTALRPLRRASLSAGLLFQPGGAR